MKVMQNNYAPTSTGNIKPHNPSSKPTADGQLRGQLSATCSSASSKLLPSDQDQELELEVSFFGRGLPIILLLTLIKFNNTILFFTLHNFCLGISY